jgi:asparagine synthetase B (glutamine-hydrolysing)
MASYLGFNIEYIDDVMQEDDYEKAIVAYEHNLDYGSLMPQYKLFKKAKQLGINTVITGDGADELFGGYGRCLIEDTQRYDIFQELPYFHHIRIDRMSMMHTIEARNPFLSTEIILFALSLPYNKRKGKSILKEAYRDLIPFVDMKKKPLRLKGDKQYNIENINSKFYKYYAKTI